MLNFTMKNRNFRFFPSGFRKDLESDLIKFQKNLWRGVGELRSIPS